MRTVSSLYAREYLPELLQAVAQGERILIELHGQAIAELGPPSASMRLIPKLGTGKGRVRILDPRWAEPMMDEEVDALIDGRY